MKYSASQLFLILLFAPIFTFGQIITDKTFHDFGEVNKEDKKYVDFKLTNVTDADIKIIKHILPYGVSVRYSEKVIGPDESVLVRIKYTPKRKGEFNADVPIYVSSNNEPIVLTVRGEAKTVNVEERLDVPEFTEVHEEKADETFDLDIRVIRQDDKSPVDNAKMDVIWNGVMYRKIQSNEEGVVHQDFVPDKYYIVVNAEGLGTFESEMSIHRNIQEFVIELGPEGTISQVTEDSSDVYETEIVEVQEEPELEEEVVVIPVDTTPAVKESENPEFPDNVYKANNIVFLIDVSVSMKQKGKMNLLKASMIELTNLLRSVDKVAIVTYSDKAELVLESTSAKDKAKIIDVIQNLEPRGSTLGAKGAKKAYQVLGSNEIVNGNNQIFISTDGAFNLEKRDRGLIDMARRNSKKGYKISVIGIKNEKWTVKNMKMLAEEGKGNYIHISNFNDAKKKLVEEVKMQSRTNP